MKCPLLTDKNYGAQLERTMQSGDCIKEECAWYLMDIGMCAMRDLALELRYTQLRVADIARLHDSV